MKHDRWHSKIVTAFLMVIVIVISAILSVAAESNYDESVDGDLSGDRLNPTVLNFTAGDNLVTATSIKGDLEYFTFSVSESHELDKVILKDYSPTGNGADQTAMIGIQKGSIFTVEPNTDSAALLLGWAHFGPQRTPLDTNMLDKISLGATSLGFDETLPVGSYTIWTQQTNDMTATTYTLNFVISPILTQVDVSRVASTVDSSLVVSMVVLCGMILGCGTVVTRKL